MFVQYLSSMIMITLIGGLYVLNFWVTLRQSDVPGDIQVALGPRLRRRGAKVAYSTAVIVGVALVAIALWQVGLTPAMAIIAAACGFPVLVSYHVPSVKIIVVGGVIATVMLLVFYPGVLSVQILALMPMFALAGFLPRLMGSLGSRSGRPHYWLMSVPMWIGIVIAACLIDSFLILDAVTLVQFAVNQGVVEGPIFLWFAGADVDLVTTITQGQPMLSLGIFTPYAIFGLLSALALWSRELRTPGLAYLPMLFWVFDMMLIVVVGMLVAFPRLVVIDSIMLLLVGVVLAGIFSDSTTLLIRNKHD